MAGPWSTDLNEDEKELHFNSGGINKDLGAYGRFTLIIFCLALIVHLYFSTAGWRNPLLDVFEFRQTQTALSTYYMLHEKASIAEKILNYQTPVLGKPWSIPMEFPLYQAITAFAANYFINSLDQAGRFVSLLFFYLTLIPAFFFLRRMIPDRRDIPLFLAFLLVNPIFIFWSRSFMIESTAVFFGMCFLSLNTALLPLIRLSGPRKKKITLAFLATICGIACGLTKVTTFIVFFSASSILYLYYVIAINHGERSLQLKLLSYLQFFILIFGISLAVAILWVHYTDSIKTLNPLARDFIVSSKLTLWNYGTVKQRMDLIFGGILFSNHYRSGAIIFGLVCLLIGRRFWTLAYGSLFVYLIGPLLFTNLYIVHSYYWYANTIFLVLFVGFGALSLLHSQNVIARYSSLIFICFFCIFSIKCYKKEYYKLQINKTTIPEVAMLARMNTSKDSVILIYGDDWSSVIPYYSQRKALMDRWKLTSKDPRFIAAMRELNSGDIGSMIIPSDYATEFINEKISYFHFNKSILTKDGKFLFYYK